MPQRRLILMLPGMLILALLFSACGTQKGLRRANRDFNYFQRGLDSMRKVSFKPLTIQPNDIISITVTSNTMNQEQVAIFAVTNGGGMTQATGGSMMNQQQTGAALYGYLVDPSGYINFPLLGKIRVDGLTREQLAVQIQNQLAQAEFVKEPNVLVRFMQLKVNVLGEVKAPGQKNFNTDRISVLDAIGAAGDLTDRGRRDRVIILREDHGVMKAMPVNLIDADFIGGEAYQLQQNDIVYVAANDNKLRETSFNPSTMRDLQIGATITSLAGFLINFLFILSR